MISAVASTGLVAVGGHSIMLAVMLTLQAGLTLSQPTPFPTMILPGEPTASPAPTRNVNQIDSSPSPSGTLRGSLPVNPSPTGSPFPTIVAGLPTQGDSTSPPFPTSYFNAGKNGVPVPALLSGNDPTSNPIPTVSPAPTIAASGLLPASFNGTSPPPFPTTDLNYTGGDDGFPVPAPLSGNDPTSNPAPTISPAPTIAASSPLPALFNGTSPPPFPAAGLNYTVGDDGFPMPAPTTDTSRTGSPAPTVSPAPTFLAGLPALDHGRGPPSSMGSTNITFENGFPIPAPASIPSASGSPTTALPTMLLGQDFPSSDTLSFAAVEAAVACMDRTYTAVWYGSLRYCEGSSSADKKPAVKRDGVWFCDDDNKYSLLEPTHDSICEVARDASPDPEECNIQHELCRQSSGTTVLVDMEQSFRNSPQCKVTKTRKCVN